MQTRLPPPTIAEHLNRHATAQPWSHQERLQRQHHAAQRLWLNATERRGLPGGATAAALAAGLPLAAGHGRERHGTGGRTGASVDSVDSIPWWIRQGDIDAFNINMGYKMIHVHIELINDDAERERLEGDMDMIGYNMINDCYVCSLCVAQHTHTHTVTHTHKQIN